MSGNVKSRYYRAKHRVVNAWRDWRDRHIRGLCSAAPSGYITGGAYHFWRCGLEHGHEGPHRSRNYRWTDLGVAQYDPLRMPGDGPSARITIPSMDRYPTLNRRQRRERERHREILNLKHQQRHDSDVLERLPATVQPATTQKGTENDD